MKTLPPLPLSRLVRSCAWLPALALAACGGASSSLSISALPASDDATASATPSSLTGNAAETTTVAEASSSTTGTTTMSAAMAVAATAATTNTASATAAQGSLLDLPGTGIASAYVAGCQPTEFADFVDSGSWTVRRLEPRDCTAVSLRTPVFSWPQPDDRDTSVPWKLTVADSAGATVASASTSAPRALLSTALTAGSSYTWTVTYQDKSGKARTSSPRRFSVASAAISIPSGTTLAAKVAAKSHPRTLPAGASLASIVTQAKGGDYAAAYTGFLAAADAARSASIPAVPVEQSRSSMVSDLAYVTWTTSLKKLAEAERNAIERLAYAALLTGDASYATAGINHALALANWSPTGATSESVQDQANREVYLSLAMALDLFADRLTEAQASALAAPLKLRLAQAMAEFDGFDAVPYNSHVFTASQYVTEALMYAAGSKAFPEAQGLLAKAWEVWVTTMGPWAGSDGGYGNGVAYGWYTMANQPRGLAVAKLAGGVDFSGWTAVGGFGNYPIAMTPAATRLRGQFGDQAEIDSHYFDYSGDGYRLFAALSGQPAHAWYWRYHAANITNTQVALTPLHFMLLGATTVRPTPAAPTANSWAFEDAGVVAMHTSTADPARSSLFFRSSRLGSYNHSHADNNAFTFVSKGKDLLISGGYNPYYMSPHHALVGRATRFKNALTFDGGIGQAEPSSAPSAPGKPVHSMDTRGKLLNFADTGTWAAATGDATLAYRGQDPSSTTWTALLSGAVRSVAFNRDERVAVIYDWATSNTARQWELNFQSLSPATLSGKTARISNGAALACIDVYGPASTVVQSTGFPIAPENGLADQAQTRYRVSSASKELVAVTVIREDCRAVSVSVGITGTTASVSIAGQTAALFDRKDVKLPQ